MKRYCCQYLILVVACIIVLLTCTEQVFYFRERLRLVVEDNTDKKASSTDDVQQNSAQRRIDYCLQRRGSRGKWVLDWQYANRTNYPHYGKYSTWYIAPQNFKPTSEQPFRLATAWKWQDEDCPVTEIQHASFCQALETLGITKILVVGDSYSIEFTQSLLSLLGFPPKGRATTFNARFQPTDIPCNPTFSVTVLLVRRSPLSDLLAMPRQRDKNGKLLAQDFVEDNLGNNGNNKNNTTTTTSANNSKTAIVMNTGAWIYGMKNYTTGLNAMLEWLDKFNSDRVVAFFRETIPGHWPCEPGLGRNQTDLLSYDWKKPVWVYPYDNYSQFQQHQQYKYQWGDFEAYNEYTRQLLTNRTALLHTTNETTMKMTQNAPIHWLNVYNSSVLRRDGHIGFGDCGHSYLPGPIDWWVHFFHSALLDMAQLKELDHDSGSSISS